MVHDDPNAVCAKCGKELSIPPDKVMIISEEYSSVPRKSRRYPDARLHTDAPTIERAFPSRRRPSDSADAASDGLPRVPPIRLEDGERVMEVSRSLSLLAPPPILDHLGNHPHESDGSDHETEQDFEDERHG
jgi:hypothetical protein